MNLFLIFKLKQKLKTLIKSLLIYTKLIKKEKRKLLVLDLNGILVDVIERTPKGYKPDFRIKRKSVFKRPFCDDFLKFCFENFDVGIWSSRTKKNMDGIVDYLFGDMKHQLLFYWDQSYCTKLGLKIAQIELDTAENKHKPLFLKDLNKLWKKHDANLRWEDGECDESNTFLLDDTPYKAILNPLHNAVFPDSYKFWHENDGSLGPGGDIRIYLEGLVTTENVQEFIEQNPFGQPPIPPFSDLYCKLIDAARTFELNNESGSCKHGQQMCSNIQSKSEVF